MFASLITSPPVIPASEPGSDLVTLSQSKGGSIASGLFCGIGFDQLSLTLLCAFGSSQWRISAHSNENQSLEIRYTVAHGHLQMNDYIHGYSKRELHRLREQSLILEELLHGEVSYSTGDRVLEVGCGVGAQTAILARRSPDASFHSIDISLGSLSAAKEYIGGLNLTNVTFENVDINAKPFAPNTFDHIFICFVLEHLPDVAKTLTYLREVLRPGGTITVIEGDHGAAVWSPETKESQIVWDGLIRSQEALGHDPLIGRRLYPLLNQAGFAIESIKPAPIYGDGHNPELLADVVNKIIVPMTETAKEASISAGYTDEATWNEGITDLAATADPLCGSFFYTWFKGVGIKGK